MSEKELLYYEDAIMHENSTIEICKNIKKELKDNELSSFIDDEVKHHEMIRERLIKQMEDACYE